MGWFGAIALLLAIVLPVAAIAALATVGPTLGGALDGRRWPSWWGGSLLAAGAVVASAGIVSVDHYDALHPVRLWSRLTPTLHAQFVICAVAAVVCAAGPFAVVRRDGETGRRLRAAAMVATALGAIAATYALMIAMWAGSH
ncbi:MAG: hypothetical protein U0Y82_04630 [Thermoleophilia bacterium]